MAIRGVIFDLGHTLMHLDSTWSQVFEQGAADLAVFVGDQGLDLDGQALAQALLDRRAEGYARAQKTMREVTAEDSMHRTLARFGLADPAPGLVQGAIDAFFAHETACWSAYPQALPLLQDLTGRGLCLGLFSNASHDPFIQASVDRFGFRPWLDPALSSAGTGIRKPDPAAFAPFLATWKLPPGEIAVVGDTLEADVEGARRAGMKSVWLCSREDARQEDARQEGSEPDAPGPDAIRPDTTITELADLPACLAEL